VAVAERDAIATEMRRHQMVVLLLCDGEATESLERALKEEAAGLEVPFEELRRKYGTRHGG